MGLHNKWNQELGYYTLHIQPTKPLRQLPGSSIQTSTFIQTLTCVDQGTLLGNIFPNSFVDLVHAQSFLSSKQKLQRRPHVVEISLIEKKSRTTYKIITKKI